MIILQGIVFTCGQMSVQVKLPRANMVIDPRPIEPQDRARFQCEYHDNGTTVTLTRLENYERWEGPFSFRMYDPVTETVPSFDSTIYTYMGEDDERAPYDTTVLFIHPSVTVIKEKAFYECKRVKKCIMHDGVHTIKEYAFQYCWAMKVIRLSRSLTHIGKMAFFECSSLEAVFLPPTVNQIDKYAFRYCPNLRILPLPLNIDISQLGRGMLVRSHIFFQTTQYDWDKDELEYDNNRVHEEIIHFYHNQVPPLHKSCLDTHVTHQTIQQCIDTHGQATASITDHDGMTPLHILAMNPHADVSTLLACFDLDMSIAFVEDSRGNTPLDYLRVHHDDIEDHTLLVYKLCEHWGVAAGLSQDNQQTSTKRKRVN